MRRLFVILATLSVLSLAAQNEDDARQFQKLAQVFRYLSGLYVDEVEMKPVVEGAITGMLEELDPHSAYIGAEEMKGVQESFEGEFSGIGVEFNVLRDTVIVVNTIAGGPAERVGVRANDRIVRIDTLDAVGMSRTDVPKHLRGKTGTKVGIDVVRHGTPGRLHFVIVRDKIPLNTVDASYLAGEGIGYIKVNRFGRTTMDEFTEAYRKLGRPEGLILDLRGNSGGFLDQAIAIANEFLPADKLIVYTEDRNHQRIEQYSDGTGSAADLDLAVLVDEGSASSSEILAGALQDNDRGTIIGRRSFGKGLVQQQIPYADGSALRLTVARYYTPTGRSIQKPYTSGDAESYDADIWNRYQHNEFFSADSIRFDDALRRTTPGGKVVYGGGGIMPDIFVPLDTTDLTKYYLEVSGRNILYRYTIEYADAHRKALNAVRTTADLRALLDADRGLVDDFIRYAARKGVAPRYGDIARSRQLMEAQLKAYIGRNTALEDSGYFLSSYPEDEVIVRAIGELEHPTIPTVKAAEAVAEGEPAEEQPAEEEPAEEAPHD